MRLCWTPLLLFDYFEVHFLRFSTYTIISCTNIHSFISPLLICNLFISFSYPTSMAKTSSAINLSLSMLPCIFIFIQFIVFFRFPVKFPHWPMNNSEVSILAFKCLEIFPLSLFYWFVIWYHFAQRIHSVLFQLFKFIEVCFRAQNMIFLYVQ